MTAGKSREIGRIRRHARVREKVRVAGADKEVVGEIAAKIRALRVPDPYKAKGVKYAGEYIRRKAGKAGKVGAKV